MSDFFTRQLIVMDNKTRFNHALTALVAFSATKGNEITMEDVKMHFKDIIEDDSQYQFIYDYLSINKIRVKGFTPTSFFDDTLEDVSSNVQLSDKEFSNTPHKLNESEEELSFIEMYKSDMKNIIPLSVDEKLELTEALLLGDTSVTERLIEGNLSVVAQIAENYRGQGVTFGDLIQEGNIGLMLAISEFHNNSGDFDTFIRKKISIAIENTINEQINSDRVGQHLADKLNILDKTTNELSEKLGRVPDIEELSEAMGIEQEEVSLLLKTSLDTLSIHEDTNITHNETSDNSTPDLTTPSSGTDPLVWRHGKN